MMYRDDDMPQGITIDKLEQIHNEFVKRDKIHTMCILASHLESSPEFVNFINSHDHIELVLHGWTHIEYAKEEDEKILEDLEKSIQAFTFYFGIAPKEWHPPWNGWVREFQQRFGDGFSGIPKLQRLADRYDIKVVSDGRHMATMFHGEKHEVVYFHHWHQPDIELLPKVLDLKE